MTEAPKEVCIQVAAGEAVAQQLRAFLASHGIPCRFQGEALRNVHGFTLNGLGEVRILVPAEFEAEARDLLRRVDDGSLELADDMVEGQASDDE